MKINLQKQKNPYSEAEFNIASYITYGQVMLLREFKDDELKMQDEMIKMGVIGVILNGEHITDKGKILEIFKELDVDSATEVVTAISKLIKADENPKALAA